jgi:hypothetical protein
MFKVILIFTPVTMSSDVFVVPLPLLLVLLAFEAFVKVLFAVLLVLLTFLGLEVQFQYPSSSLAVAAPTANTASTCSLRGSRNPR